MHACMHAHSTLHIATRGHGCCMGVLMVLKRGGKSGWEFCSPTPSRTYVCHANYATLPGQLARLPSILTLRTSCWTVLCNGRVRGRARSGRGRSHPTSHHHHPLLYSTEQPNQLPSRPIFPPSICTPHSPTRWGLCSPRAARRGFSY